MAILMNLRPDPTLYLTFILSNYHMADAVRHYNCHDNIGPTALISAWTEAAIATLVVFVRFVTAIWIVKKLGTDDWIMLLALVGKPSPAVGVSLTNRYS